MGTPVRSSAADRPGPRLWDGAVVLAVLIAAGALFWWLRPAGGGALTLTIRLDGAVAAVYDMTDPGIPETIPVDAPWPLRLERSGNRVRVAESSCPGRDCVHTGWIGRAGEQIICLPNKLIISLTGGRDTSTDNFDVIAG